MITSAAELGPRVLLMLDSLRFGGAERLTVSLALGLRARGVDARVAYLSTREGNPLAERLHTGSVPLHDLRVRSLFDPRPVLRLAAYLRRERIDLVHTHLRYANLVGRAAAALAGRPVVSTVHNLVETETGWREGVRRRLDYLSARRLCAAVILVCEAQRRAFSRAARVESRRLETHLNGVDTTEFRPDPAARARVRAELGIADEAPLFATVAMLLPVKGLPYLVEAAALMRSQVPAARFLVVGDGRERGPLAERTARLGLGDVVVWTGARHDVSALLAAADVYVHPSLCEALPTSVLEAMAVGLPVVATAVGGVPQIVCEGRTGLLVPPADARALAAAMERLLDPALRARLGAAGRAWVERHASTEVWLDGLEQVYRRVSRKYAGSTRARQVPDNGAPTSCPLAGPPGEVGR